MLVDELNIHVNYAIGTFDRVTGEMVDIRRGHNVMVNTGRNWAVRRLGSSDYAQVPPTPHTTEVIAYMGFGCGGALQTNNTFARTQAELVTVVALEDAVPFTRVANLRTYLKRVDNQASTSVYFPGNYSTVFVLDVLETELSFTGNATRTSGVTVGTSVPISEAGLYLNTALPTFDHTVGPVPVGQADPAAANRLVCYNTFDPLAVTPNVVLRAEWVLRL